MGTPLPEFAAVAKITPEIQEQILQSSNFLAMVKSYVVDSPETAVIVNADLQKIKRTRTALDNVRKSIVAPLDEARKNAQAFFNPALQAMDEAEAHCKTLLLGYQERVEAEQREARARAEAEARRQQQEREAIAAAARAKAEQEAAEKRRQAEVAEAARQKALAEGNAKAASKAAADAARATEQAAAIVERAETKIATQETLAPTTIIPVVEAPKIQGLSSRSTWKARVIDKQALIRAAGTDTQLAALLLVDEKAANKLAGALKGAMRVPGLEVYEERQAVSRAA